MLNFPQDSKITGIAPSGAPQYDRRYTSADLRSFYNAQFTNGYIYDYKDGGMVFADGNYVTVAPGAWTINGAIGQTTNAETLSIEPFDGNNRIDSIAVRLDISEDVRGVSLVVNKGTEAASPQPPAPVRQGDVYELVIAHVAITADGVSVADTREDSILCGRSHVRATVDTQPATVDVVGGFKASDDISLDEQNRAVINWQPLHDETDRAKQAEADEQARAMAAEQAEAERAKAAEAANSEAIGEESTARAAADAELLAKINASSESAAALVEAEKNRAMQAERDNSATIVAESERAKKAENDNATAIVAETTRATTREDSLSEAIKAEVDRATKAERDVKAEAAADLEAEANRATAAEEKNAAAIVEAKADATAKVAAEQERATEAEANLRADLEAEANRATAAEEKNAASIKTETGRATAAEKLNADHLDAEKKRAEAAERTNADAISAVKSTVENPGDGLKFAGGKISVDIGNGLDVNNATKMLEVPIGDGLSYTSDGIAVKDGGITNEMLSSDVLGRFSVLEALGLTVVNGEVNQTWTE